MIVKNELDVFVSILLLQFVTNIRNETQVVLFVCGLELLEQWSLHSCTNRAVDSDSSVAFFVEHDFDRLLVRGPSPSRSHPAIETGLVAVDDQLLVV